MASGVEERRSWSASISNCHSGPRRGGVSGALDFVSEVMASRTSKIIIGSIAVVLLALLLPTLVLIKVFFITYYRIPQNGMYPSLPAGSLFFAAKRPYAAPSEVKRGDIVVFTRGEGDRRYNYVWRVIGLPGDTIEAAGASLVI